MPNNEHETVEKQGQCLCGAVKFRADIKSNDIGVCHCSMCRRWSGGVMFAVEFAGDLKFDDNAALGLYESSDWGERGFCKNCGTSLFWRMRGGGHGVVTRNALVDPDDGHLTHEIFIDDKPAFYNFAETTQKMTGAEIFAMFAPKKD